MVDSIPLSAFEDAADSVIVSDASGRLRLVNRSARRLLDLAETPRDGLPCWRVCRLRTTGDTSFCAPCCPIQKLALGGVPYSRRTVLFSSSRGTRTADLLSIALPPIRGGRCAVFHLIAPHEHAALERPGGSPRPTSISSPPLREASLIAGFRSAFPGDAPARLAGPLRRLLRSGQRRRVG